MTGCRYCGFDPDGCPYCRDNGVDRKAVNERVRTAIERTGRILIRTSKGFIHRVPRWYSETGQYRVKIGGCWFYVDAVKRIDSQLDSFEVW